MTQHFFIGVDGGATKSTIRVEDAAGKLLGRVVSGPASVRLSVPQAWQSINVGLQQILSPLAISLEEKKYSFHAGMGLAGCEVKTAYHAFLHHPHFFQTLTVVSDAYVACLGAHGGKDGEIIVVGTGVIGLRVAANHITQVGGWGFPHDDRGSGAWLGLEAIKLTLQWLDGRLPESGVAKAVYAYFSEDHNALVSWANQANSTAFAELAPLVIQQSKRGDAAAIHLLQLAARAVDKIGEGLIATRSENDLPCALTGGIAEFIQPFLGEALCSRLQPCQLPPDAGAILLARKDNHD